MMQQGANEGKVVTLQWSGDLTIRRIAELKMQLQGALAAATSVSIRIAPDAICDVTVFQLLCAAHRTASRQGKTLEVFDEFPEQFKAIMSMAGFSRHIGCALDVCGTCLWQRLYPQLSRAENHRHFEPTCLSNG